MLVGHPTGGALAQRAHRVDRVAGQSTSRPRAAAPPTCGRASGRESRRAARCRRRTGRASARRSRTSRRRAVEVEQAVVEGVVELAPRVAVALAAVAVRRLPLGGSDHEGGVGELGRSPLAWSACRWVITTTSTSAGSIPSSRSCAATACSASILTSLKTSRRAGQALPGRPRPTGGSRCRRGSARRRGARRGRPAPASRATRPRHADAHRPQARQPALVAVEHRRRAVQSCDEQRPEPDGGALAAAGQRQRRWPGLTALVMRRRP